MPNPCLARLGGLMALLPLPFQAPAGTATAAPPETPAPKGLVSNAAGAFQGYTFFAPLSSSTTFLLDMQGRVVHRWPSAFGPSAVYLLDDGSVLRSARLEDNKTFQGGGICGRLERIAWDGSLVWEYELATEDQTQHHDALPMPNGNVLLITWEYRYREDVLAVGRDPAHVPDKGLWPDAVLEIRPTPPKGGEIVWEWHAWDHLVQDFDRALDRYGSVPELPGRLDINYDHRDQPPLSEEERRRQEELEAQMRAVGYAGGDEEEGGDGAKPAVPDPGRGPDWLHTNAIDYHPGLDLVLLSSPNLSEIYVIDHSTTSDQAAGTKGGKRGQGGEILWRWGNPRNYGAGTDADRHLFFQHNAQWIDEGLPGAGHVLVFNNGQERPGGEYSSVEELELPFDGQGFTRAPGKPYGPSAPVWTYTAPDKASFYGSFISGCQRLPNGNTLICQGPEGRLFEVTPAGATVWEYWNELGGDLKSGGGGADARAVFRAVRVAPEHPALKGRTLTPEPAPSPTGAGGGK